MKIPSQLLAICVLQSYHWEVSAFFASVPKTRPFRSLRSTYLDTVTSPARTSIIDGPAPSVGVPISTTGETPEARMEEVRSIWDTSAPSLVQGGSLRTWSFHSPYYERVQVLMKTAGRPLNANVDLWQGPDNTPQTLGIYIENGDLRPFSAIIETPRGSNSIAIRNTGYIEFPLRACVEAEVNDGSGNGSSGLLAVTRSLEERVAPRIVQGGAVSTYPFAPSVLSVQILLKTDGRPLNARVELLQGPNNNKQVIEIYTENGDERPFFAVLESPGVGNVVRIINTAPMEFPMTARVEPYLEDDSIDDVEGADGWLIDGSQAF